MAISEAHEQAVFTGPRPGGVSPRDAHALGTARPAHARVGQGVLQTPALGVVRSSAGAAGSSVWANGAYGGKLVEWARTVERAFQVPSRRRSVEWTSV